MRKILIISIIALSFFYVGNSQDPVGNDLIPAPRKYELISSKTHQFKNVFIVSDGSGNILPDLNSFKLFLPEINVETIRNKSKKINGLIIYLISDKNSTPVEGYKLKSINGEVFISAAGTKGFFYGIQTLIQLIRREGEQFSVQSVEIEDYPAFAIRGFMHDTGRNFQTIESLKHQMDIWALYKINVFHWHLTDHPAWRIECKAYPQLNDPQFQRPGRDAGKFYTYGEIRDLIDYARKRNITVIPEIDVPGHSAYFLKTFGFKMESAQGIAVLEQCFKEFFTEISAADCPWFHLGSDEVRIENPSGFIARMEDMVRKHNRTPIVWNPGLPAGPATIQHLWSESSLASKSGIMQDLGPTPFIDATMGYVNNFDPLILYRRIFLRTPCNRETGDKAALGGILCCWPDVRVDDKSNILRHNPVYPALLAFSERYWRGGEIQDISTADLSPEKGTSAWIALADFERRTSVHQKKFLVNEPFPWFANSDICWNISGPFKNGGKNESSLEPEKAVRSFYLSDGDTVRWHRGNGGTIDLQAFQDRQKFNSDDSITVYALTHIYSEQPRTLPCWIGFETPRRSNRRFAGIPEQGKWDANGGNIWINDQAVPPPVWTAPGKYRYLLATWSQPAEEIPFTDEEFYWCRKPVDISLLKGWNKVLIRVPKSYAEQNWTFTFVPLEGNVIFSTSKE